MADLPKPRVQRQLRSAWPRIRAAVDEGFNDAATSAIDELVPVVEEKNDPVGPDIEVREQSRAWGTIHTFATPGGPTVEIEHRLFLTAGRLSSLRSTDVRSWASEARLAERDEILRQLADAAPATEPQTYAPDNVKNAQPPGFGGLRLVTFAGADPTVADGLTGWKDRIKPVDFPPTSATIALLFHTNGGPVVRRIGESPAELGWDASLGGAAVLTLVTRFRLERIAKTTCHFTRAAPSGAEA